MLVLNDKCLLGDSVLDLTEGIEKMRADTAQKVAKHRIPDQKLLEDHDMARGWEMEWTDFVSRLTKMKARFPVLIEKGGMDNAVAVRVVKRNAIGEDEKVYVSGFYKERMPEFSSVIVDDKGLPKREVRGWRTVLLALIRAGALTEAQVELTFGPITTGERSVLWARSLKTIR